MVNENKIRFLSELEMQQNNFEIERVGDRILTKADLDIFGGADIDEYIGLYWRRVMGYEAFGTFVSFLMRATSTNNTIHVSKVELISECGMSIKRTNKSIKRLKKFGFIQEISLKGYVRNVYVVRNQTIPIIPQKKYKEFPEDMKLEHDEYLSSRL